AWPAASVPRPDNSLISPVNWPDPMVTSGALPVRPSRRVIWISPLSTSHAGAWRSPTLKIVSPGAKVRGGPLAKRLALCIWAASRTGKICSRRFSINDMSCFPGGSPDCGDPDLGTGSDFCQRLHVANGLGKNVAGACQPALVALG